MPLIETLANEIRAQGNNLDKDRIRVNFSKAHEHKLWLSETTAFLNRDHESFLPADMLDNEKMIMAACAAYLNLMKRPTPEIMAYFAFWSAKNHQTDDVAAEIQQFARELETKMRHCDTKCV
jgi:hypothetical protein